MPSGPHYSGPSGGDRPLSDPFAPPSVSYCRVDAAGVPAEWVEASVATEGQRTIVYFVRGGFGVDALERRRHLAGDLAVGTRARVLTIDCSAQGNTSQAAAVENGVVAYAWLVGEGCNLDLTGFNDDSTSAWLAEAILVAATKEGLAVPASGIWPGSPLSALTKSTQQRALRGRIHQNDPQWVPNHAG